MKRLFSLSLIVLMTVLVACGTADSGDTGDTGNTTDSDNTTGVTENSDTEQETASTAEVTYTVSGAVDSAVESNMFFFCDDGDGIMNEFYEFSALSDGQELSLTLLPGLSGTVELVGSDDDGANPGDANYVQYRSEDFTNYQQGTGQLMIESYPAAPGDTFVATLTAELADDEGNTVNIEGSFNLTASESSYEDCPAA